MTLQERVRNSLMHKESDLIPYHADFTGQEHEKVAAYLGDDTFEEHYGLHIHYIQYCGWPTELADRPEHFQDDFGVVWNRSGADKDIGVVDHPQIEDLED